MRKIESDTIKLLRFPLIVAVVFIHTNLGSISINGHSLLQTSYPIYQSFSYLLYELVLSLAVPTFFVISGFLFFAKSPKLSLTIYLQKLKSRFWTLLVPYVFWNFAVIACYFIAQNFITGFVSGNNKLIADYTISDWLWAFWDTGMMNGNAYYDGARNAFPICYQFWFIRDLMVTIILSPIIYLVLRYAKLIGLIILGGCYIIKVQLPIVGINCLSIFFFALGAYFALYKSNFVEILRKYFTKIVFAYLAIAIIQYILKDNNYYVYIHNFFIIIGVAVVIASVSYLLGKNCIGMIPSYISDSNFFIYGYHGITIFFIIKCLAKIFHPNSDIAFVSLYIGSPFIVVVIGIALYNLIKKILPKFTSIITGGR